MICWTNPLTSHSILLFFKFDIHFFIIVAIKLFNTYLSFTYEALNTWLWNYLILKADFYFLISVKTSLLTLWFQNIFLQLYISVQSKSSGEHNLTFFQI